MNPPDSSAAVAEVQGLYGPFTFSEKLLQKIWAQGDFDPSQLQTLDGRRVRVLHPGRWNLLGGPDFKAARLQLGDAPVQVTDVELHLRAEDWQAHDHARDDAYDGVGLHVVLFPPARNHVTRGAGGRSIPVVALLPWLHHDLEEYAAEEAVELLANRPASRVLAIVHRLPEAELRPRLRDHARKRWTQKVHFAGQRVAKLGWAAACHQTALEILGYRFNRVPMLRLGGSHPLQRWRTLTDGQIEAMAVDEAMPWTLAGVRPANHPRRRLHQYATWVRQGPDWPERLRSMAGRLPGPDLDGDTREHRRAGGFVDCRRQFVGTICGHALSGTRMDTMICDGFLPLLASQGHPALAGLWYHWFPGDLPLTLTAVLRQAGVFVQARTPVCHGPVQGLMGWLLTHEDDGMRSH